MFKSENGADSSEMVKRTRMMSTQADSAHQGRVRMRHEWRKWVWKTNESKFEVHLLHWTCTKRRARAGYQDAGRNNIKINVSRLLFHILNTLKQKDASF